MAKGKFEGSPEDMKLDKKGAAKAGVSQKKFEGSAADKRMDKAGQAKMDKEKPGRRR